MTTTYHAPASDGGGSNSVSVFNTPMSQLDAALVAQTSRLTSLETSTMTSATATINNGSGEADTSWIIDNISGTFYDGATVLFAVSGVVYSAEVAATTSASPLTVTAAPAVTIPDNTPIFQVPAGVAKLALMKFYNPVDPAHGATGDGVTDDRDTLNTLFNTTMANGGSVLIDRNYVISSALTVPADVALMFEKGGKFTIPSADIDTTTYQWTQKGATNQYYLELSGGGDPGIAEPVSVYENDVILPYSALVTTSISIPTGSWWWGDDDSLGFSTLYVRLSDSTTPGNNEISYSIVLTINGPVMAGSHQVFSGAGGVKFGLQGDGDVLPEWWGAIPVDTADNSNAAVNTAAINKMFMSGAARVKLYGTRYYTDNTVAIPKGVRSIEGGNNTFIWCTDANADVVRLANGTDYITVHHITAIHDSLGTGDGFVLERDNNHTYFSNCSATTCNYGFISEYYTWMQTYDRCIATSCNYGFYAEGRDTDSSGGGTTLEYRQCYVNLPVEGGWKTSNVHDVTYLTPAMDSTDAGGTVDYMIYNDAGYQIYISNLAFEGTLNTENFAFIVANSSTVKSIRVENMKLFILAFNVTDAFVIKMIGTTTLKTSISGIGVAHASLKRYKMQSFPGTTNTMELDFASCAASLAAGTEDNSNWRVHGGIVRNYDVRIVDKSVVNFGAAEIQSGGTIDPGWNATFGYGNHSVGGNHTSRITLTLEENAVASSVTPHIQSVSTSGVVTVRFTDHAGAESTGITYRVHWMIWMPYSYATFD